MLPRGKFSLPMDGYVSLCSSLGLPLWLASMLHSAKGLRTDPARRKKVYRLLHRKLRLHGVGVKSGGPLQATYVYPQEVKDLIRCVFPENVCSYPDPRHDHVVHVTVEDLHQVPSS